MSSYTSVPFNAKADCYIINTCTVTARTDYQSRNLIRGTQRTNPDARIIVTGCYAQVAPGLLAGIPGVTLVLGNREKEMIGRFIEDGPGRDSQILVGDIAKDSKFPDPTFKFCRPYTSVPEDPGRLRQLLQLLHRSLRKKSKQKPREYGCPREN